MLKIKLSQATLYLLCTWLLIRDPYGLSGSAFNESSLSGRLSTLHLGGVLLLAAAVLMALLSPRIGALAALAACLFCLPLYLYFLFPETFHSLFGGERSMVAPAFFVADKWATESVLAIALVAAVSIYNLRILAVLNDRNNSLI